jgi:uncharacterized protein (TIGR00156 family)
MTLGMTGAALAQYTGPSEAGNGGSDDKYTQTTIQAIIDNPNDGDYVVLEGTLVRKLDDEMYVLSDGTTEIYIEIDEDDFPNSEVSDTTRVRIEGEVDTHILRDADIEADRVTILN